MRAEELTAAREAANLSKFALARLTGCPRSYLTDMEAGRRVIGASMAARLREALARATEETGR